MDTVTNRLDINGILFKITNSPNHFNNPQRLTVRFQLLLVSLSLLLVFKTSIRSFSNIRFIHHQILLLVTSQFYGDEATFVAVE